MKYKEIGGARAPELEVWVITVIAPNCCHPGGKKRHWTDLGLFLVRTSPHPDSCSLTFCAPRPEGTSLAGRSDSWLHFTSWRLCWHSLGEKGAAWVGCKMPSTDARRRRFWVWAFADSEAVGYKAPSCCRGSPWNVFHPEGEWDREPPLKNECLFFMFLWTFPLLMVFSHLCFRNKTCCLPQLAFCLVLRCGEANSRVGESFAGCCWNLWKSAGIVRIQPFAADRSDWALKLYCWEVKAFGGRKRICLFSDLHKQFELDKNWGVCCQALQVLRSFFLCFEKPSSPISFHQLPPSPKGTSLPNIGFIIHREENHLYLIGLLWLSVR